MAIHLLISLDNSNLQKVIYKITTAPIYADGFSDVVLYNEYEYTAEVILPLVLNSNDGDNLSIAYDPTNVVATWNGVSILSEYDFTYKLDIQKQEAGAYKSKKLVESISDTEYDLNDVLKSNYNGQYKLILRPEGNEDGKIYVRPEVYSYCELSWTLVMDYTLTPITKVDVTQDFFDAAMKITFDDVSITNLDYTGVVGGKIDIYPTYTITLTQTQNAGEPNETVVTKTFDIAIENVGGSYIYRKAICREDNITCDVTIDDATKTLSFNIDFNDLSDFVVGAYSVGIVGDVDTETEAALNINLTETSVTKDNVAFEQKFITPTIVAAQAFCNDCIAGEDKFTIQYSAPTLPHFFVSGNAQNFVLYVNNRLVDNEFTWTSNECAISYNTAGFTSRGEYIVKVKTLATDDILASEDSNEVNIEFGTNYDITNDKNIFLTKGSDDNYILTFKPLTTPDGVEFSYTINGENATSESGSYKVISQFAWSNENAWGWKNDGKLYLTISVTSDSNLYPTMTENYVITPLDAPDISFAYDDVTSVLTISWTSDNSATNKQFTYLYTVDIGDGTSLQPVSSTISASSITIPLGGATIVSFSVYYIGIKASGSDEFSLVSDIDSDVFASPAKYADITEFDIDYDEESNKYIGYFTDITPANLFGKTLEFTLAFKVGDNYTAYPISNIGIDSENGRITFELSTIPTQREADFKLIIGALEVDGITVYSNSETTGTVTLPVIIGEYNMNLTSVGAENAPTLRWGDLGYDTKYTINIAELNVSEEISPSIINEAGVDYCEFDLTDILKAKNADNKPYQVTIAIETNKVYVGTIKNDSTTFNWTQDAVTQKLNVATDLNITQDWTNGGKVVVTWIDADAVTVKRAGKDDIYQAPTSYLVDFGGIEKSIMANEAKAEFTLSELSTFIAGTSYSVSVTSIIDDTTKNSIRQNYNVLLTSDSESTQYCLQGKWNTPIISVVGSNTLTYDGSSINGTITIKINNESDFSLVGNKADFTLYIGESPTSFNNLVNGEKEFTATMLGLNADSTLGAYDIYVVANKKDPINMLASEISNIETIQLIRSQTVLNAENYCLIRLEDENNPQDYSYRIEFTPEILEVDGLTYSYEVTLNDKTMTVSVEESIDPEAETKYFATLTKEDSMSLGWEGVSFTLTFNATTNNELYTVKGQEFVINVPTLPSPLSIDQISLTDKDRLQWSEVDCDSYYYQLKVIDSDVLPSAPEALSTAQNYVDIDVVYPEGKIFDITVWATKDISDTHLCGTITSGKFRDIKVHQGELLLTPNAQISLPQLKDDPTNPGSQKLFSTFSWTGLENLYGQTVVYDVYLNVNYSDYQSGNLTPSWTGSSNEFDIDFDVVLSWLTSSNELSFIIVTHDIVYSYDSQDYTVFVGKAAADNVLVPFELVPSLSWNGEPTSPVMTVGWNYSQFLDEYAWKIYDEFDEEKASEENTVGVFDLSDIVKDWNGGFYIFEVTPIADKGITFVPASVSLEFEWAPDTTSQRIGDISISSVTQESSGDLVINIAKTPKTVAGETLRTYVDIEIKDTSGNIIYEGTDYAGDSQITVSLSEIKDYLGDEEARLVFGNNYTVKVIQHVDTDTLNRYKRIERITLAPTNATSNSFKIKSKTDAPIFSASSRIANESGQNLTMTKSNMDENANNAAVSVVIYAAGEENPESALFNDNWSNGTLELSNDMIKKYLSSGRGIYNIALKYIETGSKLASEWSNAQQFIFGDTFDITDDISLKVLSDGVIVEFEPNSFNYDVDFDYSVTVTNGSETLSEFDVSTTGGVVKLQSKNKATLGWDRDTKFTINLTATPDSAKPDARYFVESTQEFTRSASEVSISNVMLESNSETDSKMKKITWGVDTTVPLTYTYTLSLEVKFAGAEIPNTYGYNGTSFVYKAAPVAQTTDTREIDFTLPADSMYTIILHISAVGQNSESLYIVKGIDYTLYNTQNLAQVNNVNVDYNSTTDKVSFSWVDARESVVVQGNTGVNALCTPTYTLKVGTQTFIATSNNIEVDYTSSKYQNLLNSLKENKVDISVSVDNITLTDSDSGAAFVLYNGSTGQKVSKYIPVVIHTANLKLDIEKNGTAEVSAKLVTKPSIATLEKTKFTTVQVEICKAGTTERVVGPFMDDTVIDLASKMQNVIYGDYDVKVTVKSEDTKKIIVVGGAVTDTFNWVPNARATINLKLNPTTVSYTGNVPAYGGTSAGLTFTWSLDETSLNSVSGEEFSVDSTFVRYKISIKDASDRVLANSDNLTNTQYVFAPAGNWNFEQINVTVTPYLENNYRLTNFLADTNAVGASTKVVLQYATPTIQVLDDWINGEDDTIKIQLTDTSLASYSFGLFIDGTKVKEFNFENDHTKEFGVSDLGLANVEIDRGIYELSVKVLSKISGETLISESEGSNGVTIYNGVDFDVDLSDKKELFTYDSNTNKFKVRFNYVEASEALNGVKDKLNIGYSVVITNDKVVDESGDLIPQTVTDFIRDGDYVYKTFTNSDFDWSGTFHITLNVLTTQKGSDLTYKLWPTSYMLHDLEIGAVGDIKVDVEATDDQITFSWKYDNEIITNAGGNLSNSKFIINYEFADNNTSPATQPEPISIKTTGASTIQQYSYTIGSLDKVRVVKFSIRLTDGAYSTATTTKYAANTAEITASNFAITYDGNDDLKVTVSWDASYMENLCDVSPTFSLVLTAGNKKVPQSGETLSIIKDDSTYSTTLTLQQYFRLINQSNTINYSLKSNKVIFEDKTDCVIYKASTTEATKELPLIVNQMKASVDANAKLTWEMGIKHSTNFKDLRDLLTNTNYTIQVTNTADNSLSFTISDIANTTKSYDIRKAIVENSTLLPNGNYTVTITAVANNPNYTLKCSGVVNTTYNYTANATAFTLENLYIVDIDGYEPATDVDDKLILYINNPTIAGLSSVEDQRYVTTLGLNNMSDKVDYLLYISSTSGSYNTNTPVTATKVGDYIKLKTNSALSLSYGTVYLKVGVGLNSTTATTWSRYSASLTGGETSEKVFDYRQTLDTPNIVNYSEDSNTVTLQLLNSDASKYEGKPFEIIIQSLAGGEPISVQNPNFQWSNDANNCYTISKTDLADALDGRGDYSLSIKILDGSTNWGTNLSESVTIYNAKEFDVVKSFNLTYDENNSKYLISFEPNDYAKISNPSENVLINYSVKVYLKPNGSTDFVEKTSGTDYTYNLTNYTVTYLGTLNDNDEIKLEVIGTPDDNESEKRFYLTSSETSQAYTIKDLMLNDLTFEVVGTQLKVTWGFTGSYVSKSITAKAWNGTDIIPTQTNSNNVVFSPIPKFVWVTVTLTSASSQTATRAEGWVNTEELANVNNFDISYDTNTGKYSASWDAVANYIDDSNTTLPYTLIIKTTDTTRTTYTAPSNSYEISASDIAKWNSRNWVYYSVKTSDVVWSKDWNNDGVTSSDETFTFYKGKQPRARQFYL